MGEGGGWLDLYKRLQVNTEKKNQHYIPKFYLRNFSYQGNNKQIGVFNLDNQKFCQQGKLKTQGSKNFFYGADGIVENKLSDLEGHLASILRDIIKSKILPAKGSKEHIDLLAFVGLTNLRNPVLIENIKQSREEMRNRLLELHQDADVDKLVPKFEHEEVIRLALSGLTQILKTTTDLDYKLLVNKTVQPFIGSDFPVVRYNQFLESKKWEYGREGYGCIGLQIFIPLNPDITLMFYDPMVYKVGFRKRSEHELTDLGDVNQLNILQMVNCFGTIYFNEKADEYYIREIHSRSLKFKRSNKIISSLHYIEKEGEKGTITNTEKEKNMVMIGSTDNEIRLNIKGIKIHSRSSDIKLGDSVAALRPLATEVLRNK